MKHPRLLVYETDGRLAAALRPLATRHAWLLREPRRLETVLRLLERGGPHLLLIRTGRDLEREITLLHRVRERCPDVNVVLLCDSDHPRLLGLGWDLGATYVLPAAEARERLLDLVEALLSGEA